MRPSQAKTLAVVTGAYGGTGRAVARRLGARYQRLVLTVNLTGTALLLSAFGPLAGPGSVAVCLGSSAAYTIPVPPAADALLDDPCAADLIPTLEAVLRESAPEQGGYGFAVRAYGASKRDCCGWSSGQRCSGPRPAPA